MLTGLNDTFQMDRQNNMYFTIWYGVLKRSTGELSYASGGHPPSVLRKADGSVLTLATPGIAIGMLEGMGYRAAQCLVGEGDRLHIVSDGVYEIAHKDGTMWEFSDFVAKLVRPPADGVSEMDVALREARAVQGFDAFDDDFSMVKFVFP